MSYRTSPKGAQLGRQIAVEPEYRRLRTFVRRKSQRVGDLNVQRAEHLKRKAAA